MDISVKLAELVGPLDALLNAIEELLLRVQEEEGWQDFAGGTSEQRDT